MIPSKWKCPICRDDQQPDDIAGARAYRESRYRRCAGCGTVILWPLPLVEENTEFESEESARTLAEIDQQRLALLRRRVALAGRPDSLRKRLLDIGCSSGRVMALAQDAGWEVTGIEMSAELSAIARKQVPSSEVITGDIMQIDLSSIGTFDVIMALDVIEHVLNPKEFLMRAWDLLNSGGCIVLHTPNAKSLRARIQGNRWNMLIPEYHFFLFSPWALRQLLKQCGFQMRVFTTTSGSGLERGAAAWLAPVKEAVLRTATLGNALLITAEKPAGD